MSIEIQGLTKRFGNKTAVDSMTLAIPGGMYGLLGPNGAGKTTLMRTLATLLTPTCGVAAFDGVSLKEKRQVRRMIGYLPQDFSFYPHFSVYETLEYLGILAEMKDAGKRAARIAELLEVVNLAQNRKTKVAKLSGGMRRRLGIAQMLLHDPGILIVDEPTAGLDPEERIRFRNLLSTLAVGKTVLLSTHIAEDILQTCPNVAVMNGGRLQYAGSVKALTERAQGRVWHGYAAMPELEGLKARHTIVSMVPQLEGFDVRLIAGEKPFSGAQPAAPRLEDAYMLLIKGGDGRAAGVV